jgi:2-succinyl-6-hydroxy-2,4-cyclohexadiene-1-carboxylate synthase
VTDPSQASLHVEARGPASAAPGPPPDRLVLVHGFTQTGRCWGPFADDLARDHEVVAVDAPGHGGSSDVRADLTTGAELLGRAGGTATYVGYSMGGRLSLHLALARPDLVQRLVVVGATGGIDDPDDRATRRAADEALAAHLEQVGLEVFLQEWLAQPLFAGLPPSAACLDERRRNTVTGLASSLRLAGTGTQEPLWGHLGRIEVPVLVMAGVDDGRFSSVAGRLARAIGPTATVALVPRAGHSAHLENPADAASIVRRWLHAHPVDGLATTRGG